MAERELPPLLAIRAFEAVARLMSFTKAAEELGMTQAAVSYQIKVLEDRVGGPLFLRKPKRIELTEVGLQLAPQVSQALEQLSEAYAAARSGSRAVLTISTIPTFASNWLAPRLGLFQAAYPEFTIRLEIEQRRQDLTREGVDVAIRGGHGQWEGLGAHALMPIDFTPMLSPLLLERTGPLHHPRDLLKMPIIDPTDPWWPQWFREAGVDPAPLSTLPATKTGSQIFEAHVALAGHGVGILTRAFFPEEIRSGRLVQPFDQVGTDGQSYWLVYDETRARVPKIARFRDWILGEFAKSS